MDIREFKKKLAVFMVLCLVLPMMQVASPVKGSVVTAPAAKTLSNQKETKVISLMAVTGSAITYYVGGSGASNTNSGTDSVAPFSTVAKASQVINNQGAGDYEIIVQGNTTETERSFIGDGTGDYNVAIHAVTGSAIVLRDELCTGDLITVTSGAELVLGDSTGTITADLILDGGLYYNYDSSLGCFINVDSGGSLSIYPHTTLEHSCDFRTNYRGSGGAIRNNGTLRMYGGMIRENVSDDGSGVFNNGLFQLYDGTIQDNTRSLYGSGVYNNENATFEMYGGLIYSNDADSYAGGVANFGTFRLAGGSIDGNYANSNGGVCNDYNGTIEMTGGSITNNTADYCSAGVSNGGSFTMSGGEISHNTCTLGFFGWGSSWGGGVSNYSNFTMTGGVIEENSAAEGGAVHNNTDGVINLSGGTIRNNTAIRGGAVYNKGELTISGDISIPGGTSDINNIYLLQPMIIGGTLTSPDPFSLTLDNFSSATGSQWIREASAGLIADNYMKFVSTNVDFRINNQGIIEYTGSPETYYVGGTGASDANDGLTSDKPFTTLRHAFEVGNDGVTTFILQSDQELDSGIQVKGNITIKSDGTQRRIAASASFSGGYLFRIEQGNTISLGSSQNNDPADSLIIDGNNTYVILLDNYKGNLNLYSGVTLMNSLNPAVNNLGTFNMYGGNICNNSSEEDGNVYNLGTMNMLGGSIFDNTGIGIYNSIDLGNEDPEDNYTGTIHMSGGAIYSNSSDKGSGIYNVGRLYLSGDASFPIVNSKQDEIYLVISDSSITLEGELNTPVNILINSYSYIEGKQVLYGEEGLINNNYNKFILKTSDYHIDEQGLIQYGKAAVTYFVNIAGSDTNSGSITAPFATVKRAIEEINGGIGTIILQSDITITQTLVVDGTITLLSDGQKRTIYRGIPFEEYEDENVHSSYMMFLVYGKLNLGNPAGSDLAPVLVLDGGSDNGVIARDTIITSYGSLNLNAGVILQNNRSKKSRGEAVRSYGEFNMSGGIIQGIDSRYDGGIVVTAGTFTMDAGTIRDNTGEYAGVSIGTGTFIMNGGTICGNSGPSEGSSAGVTNRNGTFIMNGGEISGNSGMYAGVYSVDGTVRITGGTIRDNAGDIAGISAFYDTATQITGGSITDNTGVLAGVLINSDSTLELSGGIIGGNTGITGYSGLYVLNDNVDLSGNVTIGDGDQIILVETDIEPVINITAPLTGEAGALEVNIITASAMMEDFTPSFVVGRQVLNSGNSYSFTREDAAKFKLAAEDYAINPAGKVGTRIKDSDVTITYNKIIYNEETHTVNVSANKGAGLLQEGIDYFVEYINNINAGTASVIITGIGSYAGVVVKNFTIHKATVKSILTEAPATQTFLAKEKKNPEELLNSIALSSVYVITDSGIHTTLTIRWSLSLGTYDPKGGTYIYFGTVISDNNVNTNGDGLTARIIVKPEEPYLQDTISMNTGAVSNPADISFYKAGGSLNVDYSLPEDFDPSSEGKIILPISSQKLLVELEKEEFTELNISIPLSDSLLTGDNLDRISMRLDAEILKSAKELGKDVTVSIKDESGKELYTWTFTGENLRNSTQEITDVELSIITEYADEAEAIRKMYENTNEKLEDIHGLVIDFGHDGVLPAQADIRIYVGDREGITPGSTVYLYHYNEVTGKLDTLPNSSGYTVDKDGYITIHILHCSDYVMLMDKADSSVVASLRDQISVSAGQETLYLAGLEDSYTNIVIALPETLELVNSAEAKTSQSAIGGVTAAYRSSNTNVAVVDDKGKITAKGAGFTTIYVKVTLYSGKTKTFKVYIAVKKAK